MTETDNTSAVGIIGESTPVRLALVIVLLGAVAIMTERLVSISVAVKDLEVIKAQLSSYATREDVRMIVRSNIDRALLDVYRDVNELKVRVKSTEDRTDK